MSDEIPEYKLKFPKFEMPEHFTMFQAMMGTLGSPSGFMGGGYGSIFRLDPPSLSTPYGKLPLLKQKSRKP